MAGVVVCLMALVAVEQAAAAALGAAVCVVPTALFARAAASGQNAAGQRQGRRLLLYGVARSIATVLLMAVALAMVGPEPLGFFVALAAVHAAYVVTPLASAFIGRELGSEQKP